MRLHSCVPRPDSIGFPKRSGESSLPSFLVIADCVDQRFLRAKVDANLRASNNRRLRSMYSTPFAAQTLPLTTVTPGRRRPEDCA